jgi:LPXTG-site transpeptidase (sortase) family protein
VPAPGKQAGEAGAFGPARRPLGTLALSIGAGLFAAALVSGGTQSWNAAHAPQEPPVGVQERSPLPAPARTAARRSTGRVAPPLRPVEGRALFELAVPRLGQAWTVVEGVSLDDLRSHPGHYPGSALPGQIGNVGVAGHRLRGLFWDLDQLHVGDSIVIRAAGRSYAYRVYDREVVEPTALYVVSPDPDHPGRAPERALLTLTTCLKTGHQAREIVHAVLTDQG